MNAKGGEKKEEIYLPPSDDTNTFSTTLLSALAHTATPCSLFINPIRSSLAFIGVRSSLTTKPVKSSRRYRLWVSLIALEPLASINDLLSLFCSCVCSGFVREVGRLYSAGKRIARGLRSALDDVDEDIVVVVSLLFSLAGRGESEGVGRSG